MSHGVPGASCIAGRGRLLRTLRTLIRRTERFCLHRASTDDQRRWAATFADDLEAILRHHLEEASAQAALRSVDQRAALKRKARLGGSEATATPESTLANRR
jgi:hypothetical protein